MLDGVFLRIDFSADRLLQLNQGWTIGLEGLALTTNRSGITLFGTDHLLLAIHCMAPGPKLRGEKQTRVISTDMTTDFYLVFVVLTHKSELQTNHR